MELRAQTTQLEDRPEVFVPVRPLTPQESDEREARKLYALGEMRLRDDRLVDATRIFEQALPFDPDATPIHKALVPLYLALGRSNDALGACRKILDLDPADYETWVIYAKQLKNRGELKAARTALTRAVGCKGLAERLDLRLQLLYDLGLLCEETQALDQALAALGEVVKILDDPQPLLDLGGINQAELRDQAASTYERMINLCIGAKQYDRALALFAEGRAKYPVLSRRLNYNLAKVHLSQGKPAEALEYLDAYLQGQPRGAEAYELRGTILKQLHREHEILPALEDYRKRDAHNLALWLLLARQYAEASRWKEGEREYLKLVEESPTPDVYRGLFTLYRDQFKNGAGMSRVLTLLNQAIEQAQKKRKGSDGDPQFAAKARAMLVGLRADAGLVRALLPAAQQAVGRAGRDQPSAVPSLHPQTLFFLAVLARRTHQLAEAEQFYRSCLKADSAGLQQQVIYSGLIDVLWQAHKYDALIEVCQQGLRQTPATDHLLFYNQLSRALLMQGKIEEGLTAADKAVTIAPEDDRFWALRNRVWVLYRAERYPKALTEAQAILKEFSQPGQVHEIRLLLSTVFSAMREFTKAEEQIQLVLKDDPNDATANNNLGYQWADQGKNLEEAERLIRKAIDLDQQQRKTQAVQSVDDEGENAAYLDSLGWVLFRRGRLDDARRWLEKAAALAGGEDDPTVWDHLGDLYMRLDDHGRARNAWQKAMELFHLEHRRTDDEHYREIKHKLQLLE
jgi:tetratricopeptide (TPR) repeat protein